MKWLVGVFLVMVSSVSFAQAPIYTGFFSNKALNGYDTVAYFTEHQAVKGKSDFSTEYKGAKWLFASQQHLDLFVAEPEKYAPQYGGYCAWAVAAKNDFASADPNEWAIISGRLFLNYDEEIKARWDKSTAKFIKEGDKNWPNLIKQ